MPKSVIDFNTSEDVMQKQKQTQDWTNTIFLTLTPILAIVFTIYYFKTYSLPMATGLLFFFMVGACGLAITAGYHRLFSHKTYEAHPLVRILVLLFGAGAFQNSALKWSSDHRDHHKYTDTERDPYSIKQGFWHAHIGWILKKPLASKNYDNVPDLQKDRWVMWQHRHIYKLGALVGFGFPALIGAFWGDALGGFVFGGLVRIVLNHHFTFFINSLCHMVGSQEYSTRDSSRDNWMMSLFTYGEGYHNFHHTFPSDYRNGIKFYHWDPSKWLIWALAQIRMVKNLKRVPEFNRLAFKWQREESLVLARLAQFRDTAKHEWQERLKIARLQLQESYNLFYKKREEYRQFKKQKMSDFATTRELRMAQLKREFLESKARLNEAVTVWRLLSKQALYQMN